MNKRPEPVPYVPCDSAEYLSGSMPRYQDDEQWEVGDASIDPNELSNPLDPDAGMEP